MLYHNIINRTPVRGGWSPDRKFRAETADGGVYFLRIAAPERAERLRRAFHFQKQAAALGASVAEPLECGDCAEGFFTIEEWIGGKDARDAIPGRTEAQLYEDGLAAGRILRAIHRIPAPAELPPWGQRYRAKLEQRAAEYRACPLKYEDDAPILAGLKEDPELLDDRPQCFQHHDFHVGNFLYTDRGLTVIDFDRCGFGDPWEEFKKISWCVDAAPALARGMVDGYFEGEIPERFWRLLRLYLCCTLLGNLPWAIPFGAEEVRVMREEARKVLAWYTDGIIPSWYEAAPHDHR